MCEHDCSNVLARLSAFLDHELTESEADHIRVHLDACEPCMERADYELAVNALVKRCCGGTKAPEQLRARIVTLVSQTTVSEHGVTHVEVVRDERR